YASISAGNFASGSGTLVFTIYGTPSASGTASFQISMGGQTCTINRTVQAGTIASLNCSGAANSGSLQAEVVGYVSSVISYTGGNGGRMLDFNIPSTGVTGLSAYLQSSGNFALGNGTVTLSISGVPSGSGTASFALVIGGQSCTFNRTVLPTATVLSLDCGNATHQGALVGGVACGSNVTASLPYSGGNGGLYTAQSIASAGVAGLTATLSPGALANGNGVLVYTITGTPIGTGTASFTVTVSGQTCTFTRQVLMGAIDPLGCTNTNPGVLISGQAANAVSTTIYYTGGNGGAYGAQSITSTGVTGLTATLLPGFFATGNGSVTYAISGTPSSTGIANFSIVLGGQGCTFSWIVQAPGTITALNCATATNNGSIIAGYAVSNATSVVSYSGGNSGPYNGQMINSTGVTGLTATLSYGSFAVGPGTLTYTITGTPSAAGTASFALSIGGQSCNLLVNVAGYSSGAVFCNGPTPVVDVSNPA
ncbi:MAG: hypothetical protein EBZ77_15380, partial [Chitinophagia bacterium]|nr:hypothetical protein [Chitinophagia bacterium]